MDQFQVLSIAKWRLHRIQVLCTLQIHEYTKRAGSPKGEGDLAYKLLV